MIATTEQLERHAADVLTSALEGGIGYWSEASNIARDDDGRVLAVVLHDANRSFAEQEKFAEDFPPTSVTAVLVLKAIRLLARPQFLKALGHDVAVEISRQHPPHTGWVPTELERKCAMLLLGDEDVLGEIDADDADCIVQVSMFGGVVYG